MIKESVKKLGKYSLEIKFKYRPEPKTGLLRIKKYHIDMYFFLPVSLGVNRKNYTKMDFYREINSYLKIDPPKVLLADLLEAKDNISLQLKLAFQNYNPEDEESFENLDTLLKIYVNIVKKSVKRELRGVKKVGDEHEKNRLAQRFINNFTLGLEKFRQIEQKYCKDDFAQSEGKRVFGYADEYISTLYSKYLYHVWQILENFESPESHQTKELLKDGIYKEREYKKKMKYPFAEPKDQSKENESFLFRWEMIKNFINNKLILTTRFDRENKWMIQFYYSLAAGIAMIFATGIAFYYNQKFGNFTIRFFVILVISYMFKDRIKDWIKDLINYILKKETYDHTINIYDDNQHMLGNMSQGFDFVPKRNLPDDILEVRNSKHQTDVEDNSTERVMHYKSKIKLNTSKLYKFYKGISLRGVNAVTYFNTSPLLMRMEQPDTNILLMDDNKQFAIYKSEKVYHINMIMVYDDGKDKQYRRYRIVLNRNGIKRLKKISL